MAGSAALCDEAGLTEAILAIHRLALCAIDAGSTRLKVLLYGCLLSAVCSCLLVVDLALLLSAKDRLSLKVLCLLIDPRVLEALSVELTDAVRQLAELRLMICAIGSFDFLCRMLPVVLEAHVLLEMSFFIF